MEHVSTCVGLDAHKKDVYVAMLVGHERVPVTWQLPNEPRSPRSGIDGVPPRKRRTVQALDYAVPRWRATALARYRAQSPRSQVRYGLDTTMFVPLLSPSGS